MVRKPKGELVPKDDETIVISPIARPKTSRPFGDITSLPAIGAKPLNEQAAKGVLKEAGERDRAERYLALCAIYNGNYVRALCEIEGIPYTAEGRSSVEQARIEENWWLMHREICGRGTQHISEAEYTREIGGSRAARIAVLTRFMHAGSEQAALLAIRELNKMDADMAESSGEDWDSYALMMIEEG